MPYSTLKKHFDVAIIGAGVIGGMVARELSRYKLSVVLLEKENDVACGASKANSGIIHGGYDPKPGSLKAALNAKGVPLLYETAKQLHVPHRNNGSMVVAFGAEQEHTLDALLARGSRNGIHDLSLLSGKDARALEPQLSESITKALLVPTAGIICPYELTIAAVGNAMDNGVALIRNFEVVEIKQHADGFTIRATSAQSVSASNIVNCSGVYADHISSLIGDNSFTIIPRAGEYMLLDKAEGSRVTRTIFQVPTAVGKGILVTPTVDNNLLTGPTAGYAPPDFTETTPQGLDTVRRLAAKSVPSVDFRQVITSFGGVRASEKQGDFIIRPSEQNKRFIQVAAIDSPGLTSCVAIAKMAVEQLQTVGLKLEGNPNFDGHRADMHLFRKMNDEEKDAYIRQHPDYGKIVCRCETVSEGEIRAAIHANPRAYDMDAVKRRTRSGMGRCQGGFCAPFVMQLLAEENGLEADCITKKGKGSPMVAGKL